MYASAWNNGIYRSAAKLEKGDASYKPVFAIVGLQRFQDLAMFDLTVFQNNTRIYVYNGTAATGTQEDNGAVTYFIANSSVDKATDSVGKLFMGVQIQCAQCHNHPFTTWKQNDYWGLAQFFIKTRANGNPRMAAKNGKALEISEGELPRGKRPGNLPESAKMLPPKFLGADEPKVKKDEPYRPVFADWLTEHGDVRGELILLEHRLQTAVLPPEERCELRARTRALRQDQVLLTELRLQRRDVGRLQKLRGQELADAGNLVARLGRIRVR